MNNKRRHGFGLFTPKVVVQPLWWELDFLAELPVEWELCWTHMKSGGTRVSFSFFATPRMEFSWFRYDSAVFVEGVPPLGTVMISAVRSRGTCNFRNQKLGQYELAILDSGEEVDYIADDENEIFTLLIEKEFFEKTFLKYFGETFKSIKFKKQLMLEDVDTDSFILQMKKWLAFFYENNKKLDAQTYCDIEQEIVDTLFSLIKTTDKNLSSRKFNIEKVREIIHENIDSLYKINDIVEELHISPRTLQDNFKKQLGITPKQYLQNLRLNAIRKELIYQNQKPINVSDIAFKYGFFHSSHFTSEYKKLFGETPTKTLTLMSTFTPPSISKIF